MRDEVRFNERDGYDDEDGLHEEGDDEGDAGAGPDAARDGREDERAEEEGDDGDEGFEPALGFVGGLVGGAQSEEDGVSCVGQFGSRVVVFGGGARKYLFAWRGNRTMRCRRHCRRGLC